MESQWENLWKYVIGTWNAETYVSGELNNLQEGKYLWPLVAKAQSYFKVMFFMTEASDEQVRHKLFLSFLILLLFHIVGDKANASF